MTNPTALLHRERGFFQTVEYPAHIVGNCSHHKAIEKCYCAPRSRTCKHATGWQEPMIFKDAKELVPPPRTQLRALSKCHGARDPCPCVFNGLIMIGDTSPFKAVLQIPDLMRNIAGIFHRTANLKCKSFKSTLSQRFAQQFVHSMFERRGQTRDVINVR